MLLASGDHSFFHSSAWARVLAESYNYIPLYFTHISEGRLSFLLPLMEVKSLLTGKRGVSLPFTDYCEPVVPNADIFRDTMESIITHGKKAGWKYIELRGGGKHFLDAAPSLIQYLHDLAIDKDEKEIFNNFKDNTRRNIRKAIKEGVEVQLYDSFDSLKSFYKLNCITRKRHGLPPQPFLFFKKIYEHIISKKKGFVSLAVYKKKVIAGAVFFHFGKEAIFKYGGSDIAYSHLRPNNLVMWEALRWFINNDFINLNLGITDLVNEGLLRFKRSWGPKERIINYYKYDLKNSAFIKDRFRTRTSYPFFRIMPLPLLNLTGSLIYRHFG